MNRDEILYEQMSELYDIAMENQMSDILWYRILQGA